MENAVIYARFSSHNQREESIEGQLRECKAYAKIHKYNIVNTYIDRAISGKTDQRPSFQRMIKDAEKIGGFAYIIVYSLDRFSRDKYDAAIYKRRLKLKGVRVISAKENISNDPSGILMESLLEGMAEYYSAELAVKIRRGMTENALKGRWASGTPPYGYKVNPTTKGLEIDVKTAPAAKLIFEEYAKGTSLADISRMLNNQGYKTSRGNKFNKGSYSKIFECPAYIGNFSWNDIKIEGGTPAMIDEELYNACQRRHRANQRTNNAGSMQVRDSETYPLSSKLFCGECDTPMIGMSGKNRKGKTYRYYVCRNRRRKIEQCNLPAFPADELEWEIVHKIIDIISNPDLIDELASKLADNINKGVDTSRLDELEAEYQEVKRQYSKLIIGFTNGDTTTVSGLLKSELDSMQERADDLEHCIAMEKKHISKSKCMKKDAELFIRAMLAQAKIDNEDEMDKRLILKAFLKQATILPLQKDDENFTVLLELNISPDPDKPRRSADFEACLKGSPNSSLVAINGRMANTQIYIYLDSIFVIFPV